jgi:hypothetical protein
MARRPRTAGAVGGGERAGEVGKWPLCLANTLSRPKRSQAEVLSKRRISWRSPRRLRKGGRGRDLTYADDMDRIGRLHASRKAGVVVVQAARS